MTQNLHFVHVTCVTHNSRVSERMIDFCPSDFIKGLDSRILGVDEQLQLAGLISNSIKFLELQVVSFNVLPDHIHLLICVSDEEELINIIKRLKSYTDNSMRDDKVGHKLWAQKFNREWIKDDNQLSNTIEYVRRNHEKHEHSWGRNFICGYLPEFSEIVAGCCKSVNEIIDKGPLRPLR